MNSLMDLYKTHAGKSSDKWGVYLSTYDDLFYGIRDNVDSLLEIGVQNGGSLEIWSKYFKSAKHLIGCDINPSCANLNYDNSNVSIIIGDASTDDVKKRISTISSDYDIIIDDGSHQSSDIIKSFFLYFPMVKEDGYYIIEDLHASYWKEFDGGLYHPYSSMSFLKKLADIVNKQHWGVKVTENKFLSPFYDFYDCGISDDIDYSTLHSVTFINSVCIVKKSRAHNNNLGVRHITGRELSVYSKHKESNGKDLKVTPQNTNPWTQLKTFPEMEWENLRDKIKYLELRENELLNKLESSVYKLEERIDFLSKEINESEKVIEQLQFENNAILNSNSWKITRPFRAIMKHLKKLP